MKYSSVFEIIGPIMVGPSSSHTAGATRIGLAARALLGLSPAWAEVRLYGSFAKTYRGHSTDVAIVGGLLGLETDDPRIPRALAIARETGLDATVTADDAPVDHPNTARVRLGSGEETFELVGVSTGGGRIEIIEINQFEVKFSGDRPAILVFHRDRPGVIAGVAGLLALHGINVAHMEVSRREARGDALMIIEVDQTVRKPVLDALPGVEFVQRVAEMHSK